MSAPRQLDLDRLSVRVAPLRALLALSAALGVIMGLLLIAAGILAAFLSTVVGLAGLVLAVAALGTELAVLIAVGVGAIVVIPLGAAVATHFKMRGMETYILEDCGAKPAPEGTRIGDALRIMSRRAGLSEPPAYGILENVNNALAIGARGSTGLVLLGRPLAKRLPGEATLAVLGHEIGHIAMRDSERKYLAITHQEFLTSFLVFAGLKRVARMIFGFVGEVALAAHSREREFWADAVGAFVTSPEQMILALTHLEGGPRPTPLERRYAAMMFRPVSQILSTHPSIQRRIQALEQRTYLDRLPTRELPAVPPKATAPVGPTVYRGI